MADMTTSADPDPVYPYVTRLDILHQALELVDAGALTDAIIDLPVGRFVMQP
jgi:hypothetical protein